LSGLYVELNYLALYGIIRDLDMICYNHILFMRGFVQVT